VTGRASILLIAPLLGLSACAASSQVLTGSPREPVPPGSVRVYTQAPQHFEEIAVLRASRRSVSPAGGERAIDRMIEAMKAQAAELGANGLLLEEFADSNAVAVGTGIGTQTYTHNGSIDLGVGGFLGLVNKSASGRAIFVTPSLEDSNIERR
jgi:hypothetical protein